MFVVVNVERGDLRRIESVFETRIRTLTLKGSNTSVSFETLSTTTRESFGNR